MAFCYISVECQSDLIEESTFCRSKSWKTITLRTLEYRLKWSIPFLLVSSFSFLPSLLIVCRRKILKNVDRRKRRRGEKWPCQRLRGHAPLQPITNERSPVLLYYCRMWPVNLVWSPSTPRLWTRPITIDYTGPSTMPLLLTLNTVNLLGFLSFLFSFLPQFGCLINDQILLD